MKLINFLKLCLLLSIITISNSTKNFKCNISKQSLKEEDKKIIVDLHNKYRNEIAVQTSQKRPKLPFATNMMQLYWNEELALRAQKWANKCKKSNSPNNERQHPKYKVGENIYSIMTSGGQPQMNWEEPINSWYNNIVNFNGKSVDKYTFQGKNSDQFTQLIWAKSIWIGCGFSQFKSELNLVTLYVCHYGPSGNNRDRKIFKKSLTGNCQCPKGTSCKNPLYMGLCCPDGHCNKDNLVFNGEPL